MAGPVRPSRGLTGHDSAHHAGYGPLLYCKRSRPGQLLRREGAEEVDG